MLLYYDIKSYLFEYVHILEAFLASLWTCFENRKLQETKTAVYYTNTD